MIKNKIATPLNVKLNFLCTISVAGIKLSKVRENTVHIRLLVKFFKEKDKGQWVATKNDSINVSFGSIDHLLDMISNYIRVYAFITCYWLIDNVLYPH